MNSVGRFIDFLNNSGNPKLVAGVLIEWDKKILLVHPTNASWQKSALGIPKGKVEPNEDPLDAAVRELKEETGISISKDRLDPNVQTAPFYNSKNEVEYMLMYYTLKIDSPSEIGMDSNKINKNKLQLEEVDWAGFVPVMDAYPLIHKAQMIILDRIK